MARHRRAAATHRLLPSLYFFLVAMLLLSPLPLSSEGVVLSCPDNPGRACYRVCYREANVLDVIRFVSKMAGVKFAYHEEDLNFRITLISEEPVTGDELVSILLQILQTHGLSITENEGLLLLHRDGSPMKLAPVTSELPDEGIDSPGYIITRVFHLYNVNPTRLAELVRPMLSPLAAIEVLPESGRLVITDTRTNVQKVSDLIEALDTPHPGIEIAQYESQYSDPRTLAEMAQQMILPLAGGSGFHIVRQPGTSNLFVISTPHLIERTLTLFELLDIPMEGELLSANRETKLVMDAAEEELELEGALQEFELDGTRVLVYKVQYHLGDRVRDSLIGIARSLQASGGANEDLVHTALYANWVAETNTLVFSGDAGGIRKIKRLLLEVDSPLQQVFIEVLVLRTNVNDSLDFGVDWGERSVELNSANPRLADAVTTGVGRIQNRSKLPDLLNPLRITNPNEMPPEGQGFSLGVIGRFVSKNGLRFSSLGALIHAVEEDKSAKIVINPKLLVQDGETASIFVGDNIAFVDSVIAEPGSTLTSQSISYRDVGTTLRITPLLGTGNAITLHVDQEIEDTIFGAPRRASTTPTTKSYTKTRVHVPDGHFVVLSGQIQQRNRRERSGLPCLGGLPIVGAAFADTRDKLEKQNLIIFLRPHLMNNAQQLKSMTKKQRIQYETASRVKGRRIDWCTGLRMLNLQ